MLVKEAIIEFLQQKNVAAVFHLPGIHTLPLNQAFQNSGIAVFVGRHESNCAFMADGYARVSGKIGVVVVTPGPGLGNLVAPCMEAYGDGVPLLILHIDSDRKGWGRGVLHEIADGELIFSKISKATFSVRRVVDLLPSLEKAYRAAISERCGPVILSIPHAFLEKQVQFNLSENVMEEASPRAQCGAPELEAVLRDKNRPVIVGGRALMRAGLSNQIEYLCQTSQIPFLTTTSGKGLVREDLPFAFGNVIAHGTPRSILSSSDIVIAIGTRLRDADAKRRGVKAKEIVHIDVDDRWMGKNYSTRLRAVCPNLTWALEELTGIFKNRRSGWDLETLKAEQAAEHAALLPSPGYAVMALLRSMIPSDTITVWDLNLISYWAEYYFPVLREGTFVTPRGTSPIFYAVPAAIGAKIARPDRPCFCVTGDGSSLPALSELATLRKHNIAVVFLVYNNRSYGILDEYMAKRYASCGTMDLCNPDFAKLAQSFGIQALRTETLDELRRVLKNDITWKEPLLIEFDYPVFPPPWQI